MRSAFNAISLYVAWFAAIYAAAAGPPDLATGACLSAAFINWVWAPRLAVEFLLMVEAVAIGLIVDGTLIHFGLAKYASPAPVPQLPPAWLLSIWIMFATSLNSSLSCLKSRIPMASILAAVSGPVSYYAGKRLGAVEFHDPVWIPLAVLAFFWAIAMPLLLVTRRLEVQAAPFR